MTCPYCDRSLTRQAALALALRKISVLLHAGHDGRLEDCDAPSCTQAAKALRTGGLEHAGD